MTGQTGGDDHVTRFRAPDHLGPSSQVVTASGLAVPGESAPTLDISEGPGLWPWGLVTPPGGIPAVRQTYYVPVGVSIPYSGNRVQGESLGLPRIHNGAMGQTPGFPQLAGAGTPPLIPNTGYNSVAQDTLPRV